MSFFAPVSTSLLDDGSGPVLKRAFYHARVVGNFAFIQAAVQVLAFSSGILIVRWLPQREYAYFTIANAMQATLMLLADIGISVGLVSIGGRVWQDRHRFGELINTGLSVRRRLALGATIIVAPILYAMLARNGASLAYIVVLITVVMAGFLIQLSVDVFSVVPRLRSDVRQIQNIDLTCALARLIAVVGLIYLYSTAGLAVAIGSGALFLQYFLLRNYAARVIDLNAPENADDRREIIRLIKNLAANSLFYSFQGQITVFLISFFGRHANSVAEVGALGRLAMIFTVLTNLLINIFVPAFARCQEKTKLRSLYFAIVGGVSAFSLIVLAGVTWFPNEFLFVLGQRYAHLHRELLLMVSVAVVSVLSGTFWLLNASKAWISGAWLYIPLTVGAQIALIPFTDFSSVSGVLIFNLLSALPNLGLNLVLSYRGFRSWPPASGLTMPNLPYHWARLEGNVIRAFYRLCLPFIARRPIHVPSTVPLRVFAYSSERMLPEQVASIRSFLANVGRPKNFTVVSDGSHTPKSVALLQKIDRCVRVDLGPRAVPPGVPDHVASYLQNHPTGKQLAVIMSLPNNGPALYVDSDVLFFRGAADLLMLSEQQPTPAFYLGDYQFCGDERLLRNSAESENPANTGFALILRKLDWSLALQRLAELKAAPTFFTNQTAFHLSIHANDAKRFDSNKYVLKVDDQFIHRDFYAGDSIAIRHYVNPVRHKFWTHLARWLRH